jgi:hypothetical protein
MKRLQSHSGTRKVTTYMRQAIPWSIFSLAQLGPPMPYKHHTQPKARPTWNLTPQDKIQIAHTYRYRCQAPQTGQRYRCQAPGSPQSVPIAPTLTHSVVSSPDLSPFVTQGQSAAATTPERSGRRPRRSSQAGRSRARCPRTEAYRNRARPGNPRPSASPGR